MESWLHNVLINLLLGMAICYVVVILGKIISQNGLRKLREYIEIPPNVWLHQFPAGWIEQLKISHK